MGVFKVNNGQKGMDMSRLKILRYHFASTIYLADSVLVRIGIYEHSRADRKCM